MDWKAECGQLNLAHVTRNKKHIKRRRWCPVSPVQVRDL